jgi:DNA-binding transcriptional LysR family regulator
MELYQLSAFKTVAQTANLTRAAEALHVSQSALSTQIRNLEEELGLSLFLRQAKGMQLTTAGEALLPLAQAMLTQEEELRRTARSLQHTVSGTLTIGLNTDPTFLRLNRVIRLLTTTLPQVSLNFSISQTLSTEAQLVRGDMDMGFVFGTAFSPAVTVRQLTTTPISVVVPRHLAPDPRDLTWRRVAAMPWIWTTCQCPFHVLCQLRMDEHGVRPNTVTEAVDENIVKELALGGLGVALLRKSEAQDVARQGVGVIWEGGELHVPLGLTWLARRDGERLIETAAGLVAELWLDDTAMPPADGC